MKKYSLTLIVVLALFALIARIAYAWPEEPFAKLEITGPGINGTTSITDAELLKSMTIDGFMDFTAFIPVPEGIGEGYNLHRFFQNQDGSYLDFDHVVYFPDPQGGPASCITPRPSAIGRAITWATGSALRQRARPRCSAFCKA
ncbi:MAG: hypothetical protein ACT4QE_00575 [Anaerolineales bacterium]